VRGKFAYISPEQARNEHVDPRSDVFSVGVLLWELITNRRLFSGLGDLEALRAVREAKVPRPREIDAQLSPDIDQLLMAALARDTKNRPTAGQFGQKLRALRYSLEVTVGDPASELAKIIDTADEVQRQSQRMMAANVGDAPSGPFAGPEPSEHTVIRIRTADDFAMRDKDGASVAKARQVIDRFEEEETRQAQLTGDQLRVLRGGARDSLESVDQPMPPKLPGVADRVGPRPRRSTDEPTVSRPPLQTDEVATMAGRLGAKALVPYESEESTKLVGPGRNNRTPMPMPRPATQPPPMPPGVRPPPESDSFTNPGTVHEKAGVPGLPQRSVDEQPSITPQPPQLPPPPVVPRPASPLPQPFPPQQPPPQGNYPGWGVQPQLPVRGASPTTPDMYERPVYPQRQSVPVIGFERRDPPSIKTWVLFVGALVMAGLAFLITRLFLH